MLRIPLPLVSVGSVKECPRNNVSCAPKRKIVCVGGGVEAVYYGTSTTFKILYYGVKK